jgi:hypothetical protein
MAVGCGPNNDTVCGWFRDIECEYFSTMPGCIALYKTSDPNVWELKFWYELAFLNKLIKHGMLPGPADEIKLHIDNLVIRVNKLLPFI